MKYKTIFHPVAIQDLKEVAEYLSEFDDSTAYKFFKTLDKKLAILEETPFVYAVWNDDPVFRRVVVHNYLIFYHIVDADKKVIICRIVATKRNISPPDVKHDISTH